MGSHCRACAALRSVAGPHRPVLSGIGADASTFAANRKARLAVRKTTVVRDARSSRPADSGGQRNRRGPICSIGFLKPRRLRGRSLSSAATQSRSSALCSGEVAALREVLAQQAVGVLVRGALPGCVRVAEVDVDVGVHGDLLPLAHLRALVPGQRGAAAPRAGS